MDPKITKELSEAYNSIYSYSEKDIEEDTKKLAQALTDTLIEEGYDVDDNVQEQIYHFCLKENIGQATKLGSLYSKMQRAKQLAQPAMSYMAQRFRSGANLPAKSNIAGQLTKKALGAGAETAGKVVRSIPKIPGYVKDVVTKPGKPLAKAATVLGAAELSRALPQSPTQAILQKGSELLGWSAKQDPGAAAGETTRRLQRAGSALTTPTTQQTPTTTPQNNDSKKKSAWTQLQSVDYFDLIKGHLLDEGYASTEQQAIVIMSNMSETWKNSIIENLIQK